MAKCPRILVCGNAGRITPVLIRRRDAAILWALTRDEALSTLELAAPDLVLAKESLGGALLEARRTLKNRPATIIILEPDSAPGVEQRYVAAGALAAMKPDDPRLTHTIAESTGLVFARHPRVRLNEVVSVSLAGEDYFLSSVDISASGVSLFDLPSGHRGTHVMLRFDTVKPPLIVPAVVARYFEVAQRPVAGLYFQDLTEDERQEIRKILEIASRGRVELDGSEIDQSSDAPSELVVPPSDIVLPQFDALRAFLEAPAQNRGRLPAWAREVARELTEVERKLITHEGAPSWAGAALSARLWLYAVRSRAGGKNLGEIEFREALDLCRALSKEAQGSSPEQLCDVCQIRSDLMRALYGAESQERDPPAVSDEPTPQNLDAPRVDDLITIEAPLDVEQSQLEIAERHASRGEYDQALAVYRDAGLLEEAIDLALNVLRNPNLAAKIALESGSLVRASELFELSGDNEAAAGALAAHAKDSRSAEGHLARIGKLSKDALFRFLQEQTRRLDLDRRTAGLFYALGVELLGRGQIAPALEMFQKIQKSVGDYRDVAARIQGLNPSNQSPVDWTIPPLASMEVQESGWTVPVEPAVEDEDEELTRTAARAFARRVRQTHSVIAEEVVQEHEREATTFRRLVDDTAIERARGGPSDSTLAGALTGKPPTEKSAGVWMRLGLRALANGRWDDAQRLFETVHTHVPSHTGAKLRAEAVRKWCESMSEELEGVSVFGSRAVQDARYVLRGEIGFGPTGTVYRAQDQVLDSDVALKIFKANLEGERRRELFERFRMLGSLEGANIVQIADFGTFGGRAFMATPLLEGSVDQLLARREKIFVVEALTLCAQVADGCARAHAKGLVHGNLKPSNILRSDAGVFRIRDFWGEGLAVEEDPSGAPYRSAARLRGDAPTTADDVFALGALLYRAVTGVEAFSDDRRDTRFRSLSELGKFPPWLETLIAELVHPDPSARFGNMLQLSKTLSLSTKKLGRH